MTTHSPTPEQSTILSLARSSIANIMIQALAGVGKTTTLEMIEATVTTRPILYLAFNAKIAAEATKRMASTTTVRTFNSLGHRIWAKVIGKQFKPDPKKIPDMLRALISEVKRGEAQQLWDNFWLIVEGVAKAKAFGYIPAIHAMGKKSLCSWQTVADAMDEEPDAFCADAIRTLLIRSISAAYAGSCDFNDQLYMSTLFGSGFPEFPLVMVDEYQDLNPINHAMLKRLVKHRIIGVGDPFQSIYEFRGAMPNGMPEAVTAFSMTPCDLSVSFRCPEAIVRSVRWHVPKFKWSNPGGSVIDLERLDEIPSSATFICRNNAPLFRCAMKLLTAGYSVNVAGSDISKRLIAQMKKLGPEDMSQAALIDEIVLWQEAREAKGSKLAADTAACMLVFASHGKNLGQALAYANHLFEQKGQINFTTGHKAKGLEWPIVFHLDPWLLKDSNQDKNLSYVISTRSSDQLYRISSDDIKVQ